MDTNDIELSIACDEDAEEVYNLMDYVYRHLKNKEVYVCDDLEFVKNHISKEGFTVKACNKDSKIVGSFIFRYPGDNEDNLGRDIGFNQEKLQQVVHMHSIVVLPEYRGQKLQLRMLQYAERIIDKSKYKYFLATVSPDNPHSYKNFEDAGYRAVITKEKYDGLIRRVYLKEV